MLETSAVLSHFLYTVFENSSFLLINNTTTRVYFLFSVSHLSSPVSTLLSIHFSLCLLSPQVAFIIVSIDSVPISWNYPTIFWPVFFLLLSKFSIFWLCFPFLPSLILFGLVIWWCCLLCFYFAEFFIFNFIICFLQNFDFLPEFLTHVVDFFSRPWIHFLISSLAFSSLSLSHW